MVVDCGTPLAQGPRRLKTGHEGVGQRPKRLAFRHRPRLGHSVEVIRGMSWACMAWTPVASVQLPYLLAYIPRVIQFSHSIPMRASA
jgi:hypothetical protein